MPRIENQRIDAELLEALVNGLDRLAGEFRALLDTYKAFSEKATKDQLDELTPAGLRGAEKGLTQLRAYRRSCTAEIGKLEDELNERLR